MIVFKPLLSILSVFGLYVSSFKPVCCRNVLRWLLSLGALVFGVFAVVHKLGPRVIALFSDSVHEEFFVNFLFSLILFQLTCNSVWLSVSVSRNLTKLFESLEKYLADYNVSHGSRKRRSAVVISCVIALFLIVSTAGMQYSFQADPTCLDRKQLGRVLLCLAEEGFSVIEWTYVSSYGVLPPFLYFVLWAAIFVEARQLNRNMDEVDFETCDQAALRVEKFRLRQGALCGLVERANLVLHHFLFCSYAFGLSLLLFALRGLMKGDANERSVVILGYTLVLVCLQMVAVTLSGAILCSVVRLHRSVFSFFFLCPPVISFFRSFFLSSFTLYFCLSVRLSAFLLFRCLALYFAVRLMFVFLIYFFFFSFFFLPIPFSLSFILLVFLIPP